MGSGAKTGLKGDRRPLLLTILFSLANDRAYGRSVLLTSHMTSHIIFKLRNPGGSMSSWQVQDAKARFSEFLDATIKKGPQVVTRRGIETAVLVPIGEWNRLQKAA